MLPNYIRKIFSIRVLVIIFFSSLYFNQVIFAAQNTQYKHSVYHHKKNLKKKRSLKKSKVNLSKSSLSFDQQYLRFLHRWQIPGSSVAIIKNNQFILSKGYGWADIARQRPVTSDSVFRIASVSKGITAVAILKLIQEGRINIDSKVFGILNDLKPLNFATPSAKIYTITIRNLLEMSAGWITDEGIDPMLGAWSSKMLGQLHNQIPPDCRTAARMMMTIPMQYSPGTQYSYSNISYCMLGLIINKVTGLSGSAGYESYVKQAMLSPYGITSMQIGNNAKGMAVANEVHYYLLEHTYNLGRIQDGLPYGQTQLLQKNYSDGGWIASAPDLAKFLNALGQYKILTPKMMKVMKARPYFQKNKSDYFAKGFRIKYLNGHVFIVKTGSFTGTQALVMLGDDGTAYAALFNAKPSNRKLFISELQNILISYSRKH